MLFLIKLFFMPLTFLFSKQALYLQRKTREYPNLKQANTIQRELLNEYNSHTIIKKQQGSAIIVALFVVALVAAIATLMLTRIQQDTRRTELILNATQAYFYAQGSLAWVKDNLITNWKQQQPQQIIDKTPIQSPINKMNNASIQSTIYDAQGFFNINNVTEEKQAEHFMQLLKAVMPTLKSNEIQAITAATVDWVSSNAKSNDYNDYYAKFIPSYRSPHQPMVSQSELRLVKGMTAELYEKLYPHIIALPTTTQININNATAPVLMSLSSKMSLESAKALEAMHQHTPFTSIQHFLNTDIAKNNSLPEDQITVTSHYFLVKTQVTIGDQTIILYTLMQRDVKNSQPIVTILWQSKGTL
jgi:general secretion pathway protein K